MLTSRVSYPAFTDPRAVDCIDGLSAKVRGIGTYYVKVRRIGRLDTVGSTPNVTFNAQHETFSRRRYKCVAELHQAVQRDPWGPSKIAELLPEAPGDRMDLVERKQPRQPKWTSRDPRARPI